ncbi:MAG: hemolysin family protein [bacterium]
MLLIVLFIMSAFFSMVETAMLSVSQVRIAHLVELKKVGAKLLMKLRKNPARLLSTILIGNNLVNISASVLMTTLVKNYFFSLGFKGEGQIIAVAIGVMTLILLVFGEITPKTVAIRRAEAIALSTAPIMVFFEWFLSPIAWMTTALSRPFIFLFGAKLPEQGPFVTEEMIKTLLFAGEKEGVIEHDEREMISSVFKFGDLLAKDVLTSREKMVRVGIKENVGEVIEKIKESGHSRLPVIDQSLDNVVGVVYAKDLLDVPRSDKIADHLKQALFIPGRKKISELLDQMQAEYKHLAIVVDEFGRTLGLVTLEDLVEEIVGEIHDEYERRK